MLEEREKFFEDASKLKKDFDKDRDKLLNELTDLDKHK